MTIKGQFRIPIYRADVYVIVTDQLMRVINYRLKEIGEDPLEIEPGAFFIRKDQSSDYYLYFTFEMLTLPIINHEKSHLIDYILKDCGMKKDDEGRAYLDQFITEKLQKFFKIKGLKVK